MITSSPSSLSSCASKRFEADDVSFVNTVNAISEIVDDELKKIKSLGWALTRAWGSHSLVMLEAVKPAIRVCKDLAIHIQAVSRSLNDC